MPQFFTAKGCESIFADGCRADYDEWDEFLPNHRYGVVLDANDFRNLAEKDLGNGLQDLALPVHGGRGRATSYWGIHDDVALKVLGNITTNRTDEQRERIEKNEPKKAFSTNHYTISSRTPFVDRPLWYNDTVKRYLDMRHFTDLALSKFLDRMEQQGVLNDTIFVIVGDHGQGPEDGQDVTESHEVSATRVAAAIITDGRLETHAATMHDVAAEHYDLLNTLVDIVGLPPDGFVRDGVGRSLKRTIPFGKRAV
ncbi:Sulfatase-like protein, partial [Globisporangium splendens]